MLVVVVVVALRIASSLNTIFMMTTTGRLL